jgi:hypothetical protein
MGTPTTSELVSVDREKPVMDQLEGGVAAALSEHPPGADDGGDDDLRDDVDGDGAVVGTEGVDVDREPERDTKKATKLFTDSDCSGVEIFHHRTDRNPSSSCTYSGTIAAATLYTSPHEIMASISLHELSKLGAGQIFEIGRAI